MSKNNNFVRSQLFLALGALCLAVWSRMLFLRYRPLSTQINNPSEPVSINSTPAPTVTLRYPRLFIPKLAMSWAIYPSSLKSGKWTTSNLGLSHGNTTPLPPAAGNSVLYGHNWPNMLSQLTSVVPGDKIIYYVDSTTYYEYIISNTATVPASDSSLTAQTQDPRITLYTCTGWMDQDRFVVVAVPNF